MQSHGPRKRHKTPTIMNITLAPSTARTLAPPLASVLFLPILTTSWIAVPIGHPITATFTC